MPGSRLIQSTIERIKKQLEDANILPYSAKLNKELKHKALHFDADKMEIRVTTNAADTGFTFENSDKEGPVMGVDVIISGIVNHLRVDPETGFAWLEEIEDVRSSLEQQAGRAGRKADGTVIYLMSKDNFDRREYLHTPAILEKDFTDDVLGLINMGVDVRLLAAELDMDISERPIRLAYYPPRKSIERGISKLKILGAIDDNLQKTATACAAVCNGR
jgi:HrpA-like RNA helicase